MNRHCTTALTALVLATLAAPAAADGYCEYEAYNDTTYCYDTDDWGYTAQHRSNIHPGRIDIESYPDPHGDYERPETIVVPFPASSPLWR